MQEQYGPDGNQRRNPSSDMGMGGGPSGGDLGQTETVRYINEEVLPEHEVHED